MFNFNLKTAAIFRAVKWERNPAFRYARFLKILFFILFFITFLIFLYGFWIEDFFTKRILSLLIIFLVLFLLSFLKEAFLNSKLKKPHLRFLGLDGQVKLLKTAALNPEKFNLAEFLSFEVAKAVYQSLRFVESRKHPEINSTILFFFLLKDNSKLNFIFSRATLNFKEIKKLLKEELKHPVRSSAESPRFGRDFQDLIFESLKIAQKKGHLRIEIGDVISALAKRNSIFKKILIDFNLKAEDIENLTWWLENLEEEIETERRFWDSKNLAKKGSIARDWAAGYTLTLDRFSTDWTRVIRRKSFREIVGFKKELEAMERILSREEINNVLLIGEPGGGRMKLVEELSRRAFFNLSLPQVNSKRIVSLDIVSILSQAESFEEIEIIFDTVFKEVIIAGNVILVIDDFHNYLSPIHRPGVVDISGIINHYLPRPAFQLIAITNFPGFHRFIEPNTATLSYFEKVEISEISERETIRVLENFLPFLEKKYKLFVTYPAIRDIVKYSARYLPEIPFPKKAIDLLDEIMVYVANFTKHKMVLPDHVARIISDKTQIPIGEIETEERRILLNLEKLIHKRIINQEEAVKEISTALRRARADITVRKGPMGCFLFLGPTGVGKTETSKALAEIYFKSEEKMIRIDMSEFQAIRDIPRLIGSIEEEGLLTTKVRERPFSLILLDEIEKAHPNILNLFLQVLDEGHLTDGLGRKINFKNSIIIATSNAGYQVILEALKKKTEWLEVKEKLLDFLFKKGIFRPELINRFDAVVVFYPLTKENLLDICELLLQKLKKNLAQKDVEFIINLPLKEKIVELGYSPVFGAREMRRVIQDKVENRLASALLSGELKRGDRVEVGPREFKLIINP
ncbi:ATP-dependent Clp protease ATP-binding subunit [Patescibacteria group bacterium]|nr:ATP-dependent Clp protease ATP-binding subunit [Patescibacteria group bacterium]